MITIITLALSILGFLVLCASRDRHQRDIFEQFLSKNISQILRIIGWTSLLLALLIAMFTTGWGRGLILWTGCLTAGAAISVLTLLYLTTFRKKK